jgi:hypothetical protein
MQSIAKLSEFAGHLPDLIRGEASWTEDSFGELALKLFALQCEHNEAYRRLVQATGILPSRIEDWREIPSVPTSAFKDLEMTCLAPANRTTVFHSSGTTEHRPSRHFHSAESLLVYEASLLASFSKRLHLHERIPIICLTPPQDLAPHSSLVHMFEMLRRKFGSDRSVFLGHIGEDGGWTLNVEAAVEAFRRSAELEHPILILGTAFLYVHLLDYLTEQNISFKLPTGTVAMETGGYKGRSRTVPKQELHELVCKRLRISESNIICEYGMSELSSQAYSEGSCVEGGGSGQAPDCFYFPPWARVQIISPETGREVNEGEAGLIRVFDLANVFSVMAIQTEDLGIRRRDGFELVGRASLAEARGCSLMAV